MTGRGAGDREEEILLMHMGGLGDVCLSESVFLSMTLHFGVKFAAIGVKRYLALFEDYFSRISAVDSREWLPLFKEEQAGERWRRIVFVGKDRSGDLRQRWQRISREELLFLDMYPSNAFPLPPGAGEDGADRPPLNGGPRDDDPEAGETMHVEEYQLAQLGKWSITPVRKEILPKTRERVIFYPEQGFRKRKWHQEHFLHLYRLLKTRGLEVRVLEPFGLSLPVEGEDRVNLETLTEVKSFLDEGGIFVSNDSGMAHLAGACGLSTITVFTDFDPRVWHPRGFNVALREEAGDLHPESLQRRVLSVLDRILDACRSGGKTIVFPDAE